MIPKEFLESGRLEAVKMAQVVLTVPRVGVPVKPRRKCMLRKGIGRRSRSNTLGEGRTSRLWEMGRAGGALAAAERKRSEWRNEPRSARVARFAAIGKG